MVLRTLTVGTLLHGLMQDYRISGKDYTWAKQVVRRHLRPAFGASPTAKVTTGAIRDFVAKAQKAGAANTTVNRSLALLKRSFSLGRKATPPKVQRVPYVPMLKENNVRKGFFEDADCRALLTTLPDYLKPVLAMAYRTGCRRGEIHSLGWRQADLNNGVVRLDPGATKNDESRVSPLVLDLREMLAIQKAKRDTDFPKCKRVFFDDNGEPIVRLNKPWAIACKAAGLVDAKDEPTRLLHDCRRTGVRNLVRAGVPEKVCMAISGHETRSIFDRHNIVSEADLTSGAAKLHVYIEQERHSLAAESNRSVAAAKSDAHSTATVQ